MPPAPAARVNDYAGVLAAAERERLESLLAEGERRTGAQMVIAIFRSLEGESLEDVGIRLAERWRIGRKGLDNGVILLVFLQERKVRFEVGYGLEPVLPDAVAGQIIREVIAPRFREGRYAAGLEGTVSAVYARLEPGAAVPPGPGKGRGGELPAVALIFVAGVIVFMVLGAMRQSRGRSSAYTAGRRGWGPPVFIPPSGGGGRGGGGFSGGGGGFGGGGASGDW